VGRIENRQIGVFLTYASRHGHTLLDRALSLPAARECCRNAGIPDERAFATKPALTRQMLERTLTAGVVLAWITSDAIYGDDRAAAVARGTPPRLRAGGLWERIRVAPAPSTVGQLPSGGSARRGLGVAQCGDRQ